MSVHAQLEHFIAIGMTSKVQHLAAENLDCLRTLLVNTSLLLSLLCLTFFTYCNNARY